MSDEKGWLIERPSWRTSPRYWAGTSDTDWTYDSLKAVRFARREDALPVAHGLTLRTRDEHISVTEHAWPEAARLEVYAHPSCVFNYCPTADQCRQVTNGCLSQRQVL